MRVLVIENDPDDMRLARHELESAGHTVIEAPRADIGLRLAREKSPQAMLVDLGLPGEDGYSVARQCKEDDVLRHIPVIALTGASVIGPTQSRARNAQFDAVLYKPLNPYELMQAVAGFQNGSPRRRAVTEPRGAVMPDRQQEEIEVNVAGQKFRARGYDFTVLMILIAVAVFGAILYYHMEDSKDASRQIVESHKVLAGAVADLVKANRFQTCILATDVEKRAEEYMRPHSYCNRTQ